MSNRVRHPRGTRSLPFSFEELAAQQGVAPVEDFEALIGRPSADDESVEEFSAMLRAWRREGIGKRDNQ